MADVTLPQLGETVTEGTITRWFKNVGDTVAVDEPLFEVSTDKVDTEVPSPLGGALTEIRVDEGDTVEVGTVIAVVGDADGAAPAAPAVEPEARTRAGAGTCAGACAGRIDTATAPCAGCTRCSARGGSCPRGRDRPGRRQSAAVARGASARQRARPRSCAITGTGPGGRVTRDDVLDHIDATGATSQGRRSRRPGRADRSSRAGPGPAGPRRTCLPCSPAAAPRRPPPRSPVGDRAAPAVRCAGERDTSRCSCRRSVN